MEELIGGLITLLEQEERLYSELLKLSKLKNGIIPAGKIEALDKIVREEQTLLISLGDVERKRKRIAREFSSLSGKSGEITIGDIIEAATSEQQTRLNEIHGSLGKVIEEQIKYNGVNKKLLETRIEYINFMVNMVSENFDASNTYSSGGSDKRHDSQKNNIIDRSV